MTQKMIIHCLEKGSGSLKHYAYFSNSIKLSRKVDVLKAIELKLNVKRKDKITNKIETFNYDIMRFEE